MKERRILFVGLGDIGSQVFDLLVRMPGKFLFLVGGRNTYDMRNDFGLVGLFRMEKTEKLALLLFKFHCRIFFLLSMGA